MQIISATRGISLALVALITQGLVSCDNGQKEIQGIHRQLEKSLAERQQSVQSNGLVNTLRTTAGFHVTDVVWCGDNKTLVSSGGIDTSVLTWDALRAEMISALDRGEPSRAVACSKDGRFIASGIAGKEKTEAVRIWEGNSSKTLVDIASPFPSIEGHGDGFAKSLIFSSDGSRLYAHFVNRKREQRLVTYETFSWKTISEFPLAGVINTRSVLGDQGKLYAYGLDSRDIVVIDVLTGVERIRFRAEKLSPLTLAFGLNDETLFIGGRRTYEGTHQGMPEQVVEEYSLNEGKLLRSIVTGHFDGISAIAFRQDIRRLITASIDMTIEVRNSDTGSLVTTLGDKKNQIQSMDIRPDGKQFVSGGGVINIWSLQ